MDNCLTRFLEQFGSTAYDTKLTYDKDNRITAVDYSNHAAGSENVRYGYDSLGRLVTRTLETGTTDYVLTYNYLNGPTGWAPAGAARTNMISSINYNSSASTLSYTYDGCGRILTVGNGTYTIHYVYDGLGQLTRVDDPTDIRGGASGSTWTYAYDAGGNMTVKSLYAHCYGDNDLTDNTVVDSIPYAYDATWKDKLTSYDGNAITYDTIGNPLTYDGWTYTWEVGRQLKQMSNGTRTLQYVYNNSGLRTQKINGSTTTKYYWAGNKISTITNGSDTLHFGFDASGMPLMMTYNGTNYYYQQNTQSDIIGIISANGTQVASYTYDSWGKLLSVKDSAGNERIFDTLFIGNINPYRYKCYLYDSETGLYYLQSRYYNPELGRFINADTAVGDVGLINANNMFCYCQNNPIMCFDPNGKSGWLDTVLTVLAIVAITAVVVAACVVAAPAVAACAAYAATCTIGAAAASTAATIGAVSCGVVATGVAVCGANDVAETITGQNVVAKTVFKGDVGAYRTTRDILYMGAACLSCAPPAPRTAPVRNPKNGISASLTEELSMRDCMSNPRGKLAEMKKPMADPRWRAEDGWVKMQQTYRSGVNIHYTYNVETRVSTDFKFKNNIIP